MKKVIRGKLISGHLITSSCLVRCWFSNEWHLGLPTNCLLYRNFLFRTRPVISFNLETNIHVQILFNIFRIGLPESLGPDPTCSGAVSQNHQLFAHAPARFWWHIVISALTENILAIIRHRHKQTHTHTHTHEKSDEFADYVPNTNWITDHETALGRLVGRIQSWSWLTDAIRRHRKVFDRMRSAWKTKTSKKKKCGKNKMCGEGHHDSLSINEVGSGDGHMSHRKGTSRYLQKTK